MGVQALCTDYLKIYKDAGILHHRCQTTYIKEISSIFIGTPKESNGSFGSL